MELPCFLLTHHRKLGNGIVLSPMNLSEHNRNARLNLSALLNCLDVRIVSGSFSKSEPDLDEWSGDDGVDSICGNDELDLLAI